MKQPIFSLILLLYGYSSFAQNSDISTIKTSSTIKIAYNSSIVYPGLRLGVETPFKKVIVTKIKKSSKQKLIYKDQFFSTNIGWYHHPTFHDNVYLTFGYTRRRTNQSGFFSEFSPEIGYSRTFLGGVTYQVNELGDVSIIQLAGYNHVLVSIGGGFGYDFSISHSNPISIYYKLNLLTMFPYNNTIYLRPTIELGITYKPKSFLKLNTKIKYITKNKF